MIHKHLSRFALTAFVSSLCFMGLVSAPALAAPAQSGQTIVAAGRINWNKLGLSSEQAKQINDLRTKYDLRAQQIRKEIQAKKIAIDQQLAALATNHTLIRKLMAEKLALENQLQTEALDNFLAMKRVLTGPQVVKLIDQMRTIK